MRASLTAPRGVATTHSNDHHVRLRSFLSRAGIGAPTELAYQPLQRFRTATATDDLFVAAFAT